ncbi:MAG TPA: hypothetical protein VN175_01525 [Rhizomicrobium sp.]|nr:hypothetical protein [Rhizomicrobium sp.]
MRVLLAPGVLVAVTALTATAAWAQPTAFCPYGQTCQNAPSVPFPVINPVQGLNNVLTLPLGKSQPPPPPPAVGYAPIATPPPVLPPGINR